MTLPREIPNWPLLLPDVLQQFAHAAPSDLLATRGDARMIIAHLAISHDLTLTEATEGFFEALERGARRRLRETAAMRDAA